MNQFLYVFATTEARARAIFGIDTTVPMHKRNLPLTPEQRDEFGEYAECYCADPYRVGEHWLKHGHPGKAS